LDGGESTRSLKRNFVFQKNKFGNSPIKIYFLKNGRELELNNPERKKFDRIEA